MWPPAAAERVTLAFDLALAALLGEGLYNFGELLAHPVLQALAGTELAWVAATLAAFNAGDLDAVAQLAPQWRTQPDLAAAEAFLHEKATVSREGAATTLFFFLKKIFICCHYFARHGANACWPRVRRGARSCWR